MNKNIRKNKSKKGIAWFVVIAILAVAIGIHLHNEKQKREAIVAQHHLQLLVTDYFKSKPPEIFESPTSIVYLISFQQEYAQKATDAVQKCKNVSPLASKIAGHYSEFRCSLFENGYSKMIQVGQKQEQREAVNKMLRGQEICFFKPQDKVKFRMPSALYWNDRWKAVMIQISAWPETVFAGMLIHELGHGYYSTVLHSKSADSPQLSKAWVEEEIIMHELEAAVFNELSHGEYYRICDAVIAKAKGNQAPQILARLELSDLDALDGCLGAKVVSPELANLLVAEHLITICCRYADKHQLGMDAKIDIYRWLSSGKL
ncbi:MAG: hypothetical protein Q7R65_03210 [bacterium]|nr:hypothetical protein [bacterium]